MVGRAGESGVGVMDDMSSPDDGENGRCCAFLVPADAPALALKHGVTWIGRGSFPASPAAQKACSRRQARIVCGDGGLTIECHGLCPLYFVRCQCLNFHAEPETGWAGLRKLGRGESVALSDGDLFHLAHSQCLLKVVFGPALETSSQRVMGSPDVPFLRAIRADGPGAHEEVLPGISGRNGFLDAMDSGRPPLCTGEGPSSSAAAESPAAKFLKDMESVVASMTGYEGLEKMKLIKLINKTGAAFTGKWTARNTHLVCWKFSGPKYNMAKRLGKTILINHRWFEDCLSRNRKLPEHSYTLQSGEEVGPLLWNDLADDPSVRKKQDLDLKGKKVIDLTNQVEPLQPGITTLLPQAQGIDEAGPSAVHEVDIARYRSRRRQRGNTVSGQQRSIEQSVGRLSLSPVDSATGKRPHQPKGVPEHRTKFRRLAKRSAADDRTGPQQPRGGADLVEAVVPEAVIDLTTPPTARPDTSASFQQQPITIIGSPYYRTRIAATTGPLELGSNLASPDHRIPTAGTTGLVELGCTELGILSPLVEPTGGTLNHVGKGSPEAEIVCVICYAEKRPENGGVLSCGHEFCFTCIHKWALEAKYKDPLCPLCKAPFDKITKRSHNTPNGVSCQDDEITVGVIPTTSATFPPAVTERFCITCGSTDSPDLICVCRGCSQRAIHVFCIDPPGHVNDDWFCPRCLPRRRREQWQRLLPGNGEYPGYPSRSNPPSGRAMRSINLDGVVETVRITRPALAAPAVVPGPSRPSSRSMQPRQQSISDFVVRR